RNTYCEHFIEHAPFFRFDGSAAGNAGPWPFIRILRSRKTGLLMRTNLRSSNWVSAILAGSVLAGLASSTMAQDRLPWLRDPPPTVSSGGYNSGGVAQESLPAPVQDPAPAPYSTAPRPSAPAYSGGPPRDETYRAPAQGDVYRPPASGYAYGGSRDDAYHP